MDSARMSRQSRERRIPSCWATSRRDISMDTLVAFIIDNMAPISLAFAALGVVVLLWWATILLTKLSTRKAERRTSIPPGLELTAQPFMTTSEAAFYNVLRLTVQDEYLLFAQVPLWSLVNIDAT